MGWHVMAPLFLACAGWVWVRGGCSVACDLLALPRCREAMGQGGRSPQRAEMGGGCGEYRCAHCSVCTERVDIERGWILWRYEGLEREDDGWVVCLK